MRTTGTSRNDAPLQHDTHYTFTRRNLTSWEPFEHVRECTRLLNSFKEETGLANSADDHRVGHEVEASRAWIGR